MLADLVENDADIGAWYRRPAIIDPNGGKTSYYPAYIIITTLAQANDAALLSYQEWMWQRGYVTAISCIEDILPDYTGYDEAEKMRNFIAEKYSQWGTSFFLFLGHERESGAGIPFRKLYTLNDDDPGLTEIFRVPSDLYFSSLNGTWDLDGDHCYGEPEDYYGQSGPSYDFFPEVFVGRVVAKTVIPFGPNEVANWANKVLNYEKTPGNANGLTHVFYSCGPEEGEPPWELDFGDSASAAQDHYPSYFSYKIYEARSPVDNIGFMNNNLLGWVNVMSHGTPRRWAVGSNHPAPPWVYSADFPNVSGESHLGELTNTNNYFIAYGVACLLGEYDEMGDNEDTDTTIMEGFLEAYGSPYRGAIACVAATRWTYCPAFRIHREFLDNIFAKPYGWLLGPADAWSKTIYSPVYTDPDTAKTRRQTIFTTNLFGSPLTEVWTNVPVLTTTTVSPNRIPVNQPRSVTVTVRYFNGETYVPLSNARVTLYGCAIYRIGYTNAQGQVSFTITPTETGTIKATATKHDYKPSQANIYVGQKSEVASDINLPTEFFMSMSSSNPVKDNIKLQYGIPVEDEGPVSLKIYDVSGRVVQTVFSEEKSAGYYDLSIPTSSFSAGTYFLRLEAGTKAKTEKVILR